MNKVCAKCGQQMQDDDFLCPACGAIWGDRIYRIPTTLDTENVDREEEQVYPEEAAAEPAERSDEAAEKKQPRWVLIIAALCVVLAFGLFLIGSDWELWAGEGSTAPSATDESTTTVPESTTVPPVDPDLSYTVYTVKFVDPYGTPIQGVHIENLWTFISSGIMPSYEVISGTNGTASLIIYNGFENDVYVNILSVPEVYDQSMVGQVRYYAEDQTEMLIVLKFSDEPPIEIDPVEPSVGEQTYTTYTIQFVDPLGNPVSDVSIYNPLHLSSSAFLYSDSYGMISFNLAYTIHEVVIAGVPDGYSDELVLVPQSLEGGTYLKIVLKYELDLPAVDFDV